MNILLLLAHSIAEYDDVRMFTDLGYDVFSIGAYANPWAPGDDKRPALPNAAYYPDFERLTADQMKAKEQLPDDLIDWADVIICHHYPRQWLVGQWQRIRHKRVIWRTCGQSDLTLEEYMAPLRRDGLQIVRYSPAEERFFAPTGSWAGQDAMIRFGKYPDDFPAWHGELGYVANVTQNLADRGDWCGLPWYLNATVGLNAAPAGPGSERLPGGIGPLPADKLYPYLAAAGAYVYTGTLPASYTLGFVEALMVGVPVVSLSGDAWAGPAALWEAGEMSYAQHTDPGEGRIQLQQLLGYAPDKDDMERQDMRARWFDVHRVGQLWIDFLGKPKRTRKPGALPAAAARP